MIDPENSSSDAADILVLGGIVVTMDERRTILPDGALALRGNSILAIGPHAQIATDYSAATIVDAAGCLVIPGLIDAHTHIPMTLFRGLADDLPLHTWLEQHVWPAEHRFINPETVRWASCLGVAELLRSGVTTLCDMYFNEDQVATVVDELGMRGVLANAHFDVTTATGTDRTLAEAEQFVARWRGHSRIVPALGPHAPYTVSPELYRRLYALAERLDTLVVTHLAETQEEDSNIRRLYGRSPVRHLANLGLVDARLVAAHCVWVDGEEIDLLARARTGVVHNPRSNLKLASGIAPVPDMLRAGVLGGSRHRWRRQQQRARPARGDSDGRASTQGCPARSFGGSRGVGARDGDDRRSAGAQARSSGRFPRGGEARRSGDHRFGRGQSGAALRSGVPFGLCHGSRRRAHGDRRRAHRATRWRAYHRRRAGNSTPGARARQRDRLLPGASS